jgi:hypothetical protein
MMKKKIIGMFICTLLIVTIIPTVSSLNNKKINMIVNNDNTHSLTQADWFEIQKLLASDGGDGDFFGVSVSISGDYAIIGAFGDDLRGSAYVFVRSGSSWLQEAKLVASDSSMDDMFGYSVSISGDYAIIGAFGDDSRGSAYIFVRSGSSWLQEAKLVASDGGDGDFFGFSVSISGDYAIIGAEYDDLGRGSAYVFIRNQPPNPTGIDGPDHGKLGVEYTYCINLSDPNNDSLFVLWDWGDGISTGWIGPFGSGEEVCDSHIWSKKGTYTISVTVKDIYGATVTVYKEISIPRNKAILYKHPVLVWLFERIPILKHLMDL